MNKELRLNIPQGILRGTTYTSELNGCQYVAFFGIPYAEPPIKNLRFSPPKPAAKWNGILDATKEKDECLQFSPLLHSLIGIEDCLYLNVFTPKPPCQLNSKAVIVQIHHGGFNWGSGSQNYYGAPDFIVHHDVIYVTFNFRLHVFGFLNLNLPECAGNMGLKDQVLALKWVQQNIKYFGGDPNNVTLCGGSSGATAIHFHMMSPLSKGLFHKVILQSGYASSPLWSIDEDPIGHALEFGKLMGFKGNTMKKLYIFLKQKSAQDLVEGVGKLRLALKARSTVKPDIVTFLPSIEKFSENAFFTESPNALLHQAISVPMLCSLCEIEGSISVVVDILQALKKEGLAMIIRKNLWMYKINPEVLKHVVEQVQLFYFGPKIDYENCFDKLLELYSDMYTCEWYKMMDFHAQTSDVFIYFFTFVGKLNLMKFSLISFKDINGACHADDSCYFAYYKNITKLIKSDVVITSKEREVIDKMSNMLTNFAKIGNPNYDGMNWKPHIAEKPSYLKFNETLRVFNGRIYEERMLFWKNIMKYINANGTREETD